MSDSSAIAPDLCSGFVILDRLRAKPGSYSRHPTDPLITLFEKGVGRVYAVYVFSGVWVIFAIWGGLLYDDSCSVWEGKCICSERRYSYESDEPRRSGNAHTLRQPWAFAGWFEVYDGASYDSTPLLTAGGLGHAELLCMTPYPFHS